MKVKRYLVHDMSEAMIKIKNELGLDAVILNSRKVKTGGFFKFFKKPMLEVVAAIEEEMPQLKKTMPKEKVVFKPPVAPSVPNEEITALKELVEDLIKKVDKIEGQAHHNQPEDTFNQEETYINLLMEMDIQESIAKKILEIVQRQINITDKNHDTVVNAMKVIAREYLGDIKTIDKDYNLHSNVYLFLGPTGVGKTTTLAKIAAKLSLVENKSVGLITADTYRIAAVEQLKTYSEILGIPLEVIYEAGELGDALNKFKDKDCILIDTAGRSHKSKELKSDFDELVKYIDTYTVFLVMNITTGFKDMKNIIESYHFLKDYRLLFTKLDETSSYGNILNLKVLTGKPLSYFTTGQSVPDDIEDADKEKVIQYIFGK